MPRSRHPKKRKRHSAFGRTTPHIPYGEATIEGIFDRAKFSRRRAPHNVLLYHYTDLEAAESIIASQRFHATAHDYTNDAAELTSADSTLLDADRRGDAAGARRWWRTKMRFKRAIDGQPKAAIEAAAARLRRTLEMGADPS